jgi:hypothetical protein
VTKLAGIALAIAFSVSPFVADAQTLTEQGHCAAQAKIAYAEFQEEWRYKETGSHDCRTKAECDAYVAGYMSE